MLFMLYEFLLVLWMLTTYNQSFSSKEDFKKGQNVAVGHTQQGNQQEQGPRHKKGHFTKLAEITTVQVGTNLDCPSVVTHPMTTGTFLSDTLISCLVIISLSYVTSMAWKSFFDLHESHLMHAGNHAV